MAATVSLTARPGKTVTVRLSVDDDCRVVSARVTGDFFVYPEEAIERLEEMLAGCRGPGCIRERVYASLEGAEAVGFTPESLASLLVEAFERACGSTGSGGSGGGLDSSRSGGGPAL